MRYIARNKDILYLWVDCDPEGENICYEIIRNVLPHMNKRDYQQIYRAKFSSLNKNDIRGTFNTHKDYPNCQLSMKVDARSIIDFKVGISFSIFFTREIFTYPDENNKNYYKKRRLLSYGPNQTPALYLCVQRKKEIENFIPTIL